MDKRMFLIAATMFVACVTMASSNPVTDCQNLCPVMYSPLCATNEFGQMMTFENECRLQLENCQRKTNFQKTAHGPCP